MQLTAIHQIELTSRCNLQCSYCPHHKMVRVNRIWPGCVIGTIELAKYFNVLGTQRELAFTGLGEPLLHPRFTEMVAYARQRLPDLPMNFSTSGILITESLARHMTELNVKVFVSAHRPEYAGPAAKILKDHGVLACVNSDFIDSPWDWAGQVAWPFTNAPRARCEYLAQGWGVVLVDGRITRCCMDVDGVGAIGSVGDEPAELETGVFGLCAKCHLTI